MLEFRAAPAHAGREPGNMALINTPRSLDRFGELYHQLGGMLSSGITLIQAVELVRASPPSGSFREHLGRVLDDLKQGCTFSEALGNRRGWLPDFDIALIAAGEKSGRLDACCQRLSEYYKDRARLVRSVLAEMAYPAFLLLMVLVVFPPGQLRKLVWEGDVAGFVLPKLQALVFLAAAQLVIIMLNAGQRSHWFRAVWEQVLNGVPVFGRARRSMALARLTMALEALLNAGVNIIEAWKLSAEASGSPALCQATDKASVRMVAGETPGEAIAQASVFPPKFVSLYRSGELSGRLDQSLAYLQKDYADEAGRLYKRMAEWTPRLIFLLVAGMIGYFIITFYMGYFGGLVDSIDAATQGQ